jgi:hypothetical protein
LQENRGGLELGRDRQKKENKEIKKNSHAGLVAWWASGLFRPKERKERKGSPFGWLLCLSPAR